MRVAITLLFAAGAAAIAVGVWLFVAPAPADGATTAPGATAHPPEAAPALVAVAEVDFPAPLGASKGDVAPPPARPPVAPPKPPIEPPPAKPPVEPPALTWLDAPPPPRVADFADGALPPWLAQRVATGEGVGFAEGVGEKVVLSFSRLRLMGMVEGRGGAVVSEPLTPVKGHCLVVSKRTRVHAGGRASVSETSVLSADGATRYGGAFYVRGEGVDRFLVGDERASDSASARWDAWFDEVLTYDPLTGALFLKIDDDPPAVHEAEPARGPLRVGLAATGRGSGHVHEVDRLEIRWEPCQLGDGGEE